jgi:multiple sugar transport system permease protein
VSAASRTLSRPRLAGAVFPPRWLGTALLLVVILALAVGALFPVFWMVTTSLKPGGDVFLVPPKWLPNPIAWTNYPEALDFMEAVDVFRNSFQVSFLSVVGVTAASAVVAFPFARLRVRGSGVLFILVLSTLLLPSQVTLIPKFLLFKQLSWIDTLYPLWVPSFFGTPYAIFLLRQFYRTIPLEMDEAAIIDGCSIFAVFWRIVAPMSLPALGVVAIQQFIFSWEWFLEPLIYLNTSSNFTVAVALAKFKVSYGGTPWHLLMAASTVALIPPITLFFFTQRYFIQGIVISGVKG